MRALSRRERTVAAVALAVMGIAAADFWRSTARGLARAHEAEAQVAALRRRVLRADAGEHRHDQSVRAVVLAMAASGARVVSTGTRITLAWRGTGEQTWEHLASLSWVRDAVLTSLSLRRSERELDVEVVMETRGGP